MLLTIRSYAFIDDDVLIKMKLIMMITSYLLMKRIYFDNNEITTYDRINDLITGSDFIVINMILLMVKLLLMIGYFFHR